MNEKTLNWDDLRLFLAVARSGGLAAASTSTGKSAPTLGRRMLALERSLGKTLFVRQSQGYLLTEQGQQLLDTVLAINSQMQPLQSVADNASKPPVKISAGTWMMYLLCSCASTLVDIPGLQIQFIAADQVLDIAHREIVIGIRNRRPDSIHLAGQKINTVRFAIYASCESNSRWISIMKDTPSALWVAKQCNGERYIEVSDSRNGLDLAKSGVGRIVLPTFIGDSVAELTRVSENIDELEHDQWLVTHHDDRHLDNVRSALNWIKESVVPFQI